MQRMILASLCMCFWTMIIFVHVNAMPSSSLNYQTSNEQLIDGDLDQNQIEEIFQQLHRFPTWAHKRNSPLCDYRLQSRPLPLTSALCGLGMFGFFSMR